jgi:hypothetical protein
MGPEIRPGLAARVVERLHASLPFGIEHRVARGDLFSG